jgi:4-carboxymuconolactone decarboxylase
MARLPLVDPECGPDEATRLLTEIAGQRGRTFNVYRMLANSPEALRRIYALSSWLWRESSLEPRLQELVILRVAQLTRSEYEWSRHRSLARRVGVPDRQVDALARWRNEPRAFDPLTKAALALTEEIILDIEAAAETVETVRSFLGEAGTLELAVLIGFYRMVSGLLRSLAVDPEPEDEPTPAGF